MNRFLGVFLVRDEAIGGPSAGPMAVVIVYRLAGMGEPLLPAVRIDNPELEQGGVVRVRPAENKAPPPLAIVRMHDLFEERRAVKKCLPAVAGNTLTGRRHVRRRTVRPEPVLPFVGKIRQDTQAILALLGHASRRHIAGNIRQYRGKPTQSPLIVSQRRGGRQELSDFAALPREAQVPPGGPESGIGRIAIGAAQKLKEICIGQLFRQLAHHAFQGTPEDLLGKVPVALDNAPAHILPDEGTGHGVQQTEIACLAVWMRAAMMRSLAHAIAPK